MPILTIDRRITPIIGRYTSHAIAIMRVDMTIPVTIENIAAAAAIVPPRRKPTRGIQLSCQMRGMNVKNQPDIASNMPNGRITLIAHTKFFSCSSKYVSGVNYVSTAQSTTSSNILTQLVSTLVQIQQNIFYGAVSLSASVIWPQGTQIFSGFHFLKVWCPSSFSTYCAIIVTGPHASYSKLTLYCPIWGAVSEFS